MIIKDIYSGNKENKCVLHEGKEYRLTVYAGDFWANEYFSGKEEALRRMNLICGEILEKNGELFSARLDGRVLAGSCKTCGAECLNNFCDECSQKMWEESFMAGSQKYTDAAISRGEAVHVFFQYDDKVGQTRISSWSQAMELFAQEKNWLRFLFVMPDGRTYAEDFYPDWF